MEVMGSNYWLGMVSVLLAVLVFCGLIQIFIRHSRLRKRYSPFTEDALRLPGHTLRQRQNELYDDFIQLYLVYLFTALGAVMAGIFFTSLAQ